MVDVTSFAQTAQSTFNNSSSPSSEAPAATGAPNAPPPISPNANRTGIPEGYDIAVAESVNSKQFPSSAGFGGALPKGAPGGGGGSFSAVDAAPTNLQEGSPYDKFFIANTPLYTYDPHIGGYVVVFFTTPMLNLSEDNIKALGFDPIAIDSKVKSSMSFSGGGASKLCKILSNYCSGISLDDIMNEGTSGWSNQTGWEFHYGGSITGTNGREFSVKFKEKKDLVITRMMALWVAYMSGSRRGYVIRTDADISNRVVDYVCSVFTFVLEPDGETVRFWSKDTGAFPKNIPISSLGTESNHSHDILEELSVTFKSNRFEYLTTQAIADFQAVIGGGGGSSGGAGGAGGEGGGGVSLGGSFNKELLQGFSSPALSNSGGKLKLTFS